MNITGTSNRTPIRTTRSKSSCAKMADSISAREGKQNSFGEVLKQSASVRDTFNSVSSAERTPTKEIASSVPFTQEKLNKISEEIKNTDYSEMSKSEIYADIEKKYADSFDDFYAARVIAACEDYVIINTQFQNDIQSIVGYSEFPRGFIKNARGYADMTYDEIEVAIKEKYAGKTSFIDQLNLLGELFTSGVLCNKFGWDAATDIVFHTSLSLECGGNGTISKNEWLSRIEETGASSPFSLLTNFPYFSETQKELYKLIADDILFGIADNTQ